MTFYKGILLFFLNLHLIPCLAQDSALFPSFANIPHVDPNGGAPTKVQLIKGIQLFSLPQGTTSVDSSLPQISQYTTTALPGESIILTGANLVLPGSGETTRFLLTYIKKDGEKDMKWLKPREVNANQVLVSIPADVPPGEFILWPVNKRGYGKAIILNSPQVWWVGPSSTYSGGILSVYGKNLKKITTSAKSSWIYARKKGDTTQGVWLPVISSNKYKVNVRIPASFKSGEYECWAHNGYMGIYGWSNLQTFRVENRLVWNGGILNVKDSSFGAKGDGITDDWAAISSCIAKAASIPNSTVFFPAGNYKVNKGFNAPSNVRWLGEKANLVKITLGPDFIYDPKQSTQYTLLFNNEGYLRCQNVSFQNIDFGVQAGSKGNMNALIYIRGARNIRFENCSITGAPEFAKVDLSLSQEVVFKKCDLTLAGVFFGKTKQVFIDSIRYHAILDCNVMLEFWGSDGVSVTNSTAEDLNGSALGQGIGRFLYANNVWSSNLNMYASNNKTIRLAPRKAEQVDQNSGEQFLWEGANIVFKGKVMSFSSTTIELTAALNLPQEELKANGYGIFILNGRGVGQYRMIESVNEKTIVLSKPWDIIPDDSGIILISTFSANCVLYKNTIQGKLERIQDNIGSSGIQLYTNCTNFTVDGNNISDVVTGISTWSHIGGINPGMINNDFCYFNEFINNSCTRVRIGVAVRAANWYKEANDGNELYLGNIFRKNKFSSCKEAGVQIDIQDQASENIALSLFENNQTTSATKKLKIEVSGSPREKQLGEQKISQKILLLGNN